MRAEIVSIGTELLLGSITDTNASYLAQRLAALGIDCFYVSQVGDNQSRIVDTLERALARSELTITTGGLGPTGDDLTRESIAAVLGESPHVVPELGERLRSFFARRGVAMPQGNLKQATLIPSATVLKNPVGTAPGWLVKRTSADGADRFIIAMPGVPFEMKRMWEEEVEAWLLPLCSTLLVSRTLKILGLGESAIDARVADLMAAGNPTVAPYAKQDGVHLRITAKAGTEAQAREMIAPVEHELRERLGDAIYGTDEDTPAGVVAKLLSEYNLQLAVLEISAGAVGALSAPLSGLANWAGGISGSSIYSVAKVLGADSTELSLEQLSGALLARSSADVVVALEVTEQPVAAGNSVRARGEIVLTASSRFDDNASNRTSSQWTTTSSEVPRLMGLATLNMLRTWLLANGTKIRQVNEV